MLVVVNKTNTVGNEAYLTHNTIYLTNSISVFNKRSLMEIKQLKVAERSSSECLCFEFISFVESYLDDGGHFSA